LKKVLVTGAAGFIGSNLCDRLVADNFQVIGIDNFNRLYSPQKKWDNIHSLLSSPLFSIYQEDILNYDKLNQIFESEKPDIVIHVAGVTGMTDSIRNPQEFFDNNFTGTLNILSVCKKTKVDRMVYISTSTVYGNQTDCPEDYAPELLNPYASSKKLAEDAATFYGQYTGLEVIILRLFTVYGPRQRETMAIPKFTSAILNHTEVTVFGTGEAARDYLYISDCIEAISKAVTSNLKFGIFNIGSGETTTINQCINLLEKYLNCTAVKLMVENPKEVPRISRADISLAIKKLGFLPQVSFEEGIKRYIRWVVNEKNE
jgi:UDP-glucuronate 4-epimerase